MTFKYFGEKLRIRPDLAPVEPGATELNSYELELLRRFKRCFRRAQIKHIKKEREKREEGETRESNNLVRLLFALII